MKMEEGKQQFEQTFGAMITLGLRAQSARILKKWEPEIVAQLAAIAQECLPLLPQVQAVQDDQASPAALSPTEIGKPLAPLVAQRTEMVGDLLRDMVRLEAGTLGQILTVNGLVAPILKLEDINPGIDAVVEYLAGTKVLDAYVAKSFLGSLCRAWASGTIWPPSVKPDRPPLTRASPGWPSSGPTAWR